MQYLDIKHDGLKKFRRLAGTDSYVLRQRAQAQCAIWDEQWAKKCEADQKRNAQMKAAWQQEGQKTIASQRTAEAQEAIAQLGSLLAAGLKQGVKFKWEALHDRKPFGKAPPQPPGPTRSAREPQESDADFIAKSTFLSWVFPSIRRRYEEEAHQKFLGIHVQWLNFIQSETRSHSEAQGRYREHLSGWEREKNAYEKSAADNSAKIDAFRERYLAKDRAAIMEYIDSVLSCSEYPESFPKQWQMDFVSETGVLIIDYELPSLDMMPRLKAVKYVQTRNAMDESYLKDNEIAQIYDIAMYQTCLRTLSELFRSDEAGALQSITFNGWVNFIDKTNGRPARSCIMSLQATKAAFLEINLKGVDPKACFRALKGVGSARLAGMAAVVPILRLNKNDERFVQAHDVIGGVAETTNIAAIPREEFEYLVRDLFEKEFSSNGGEVKITRASRDHGVDAIAFDPDPIRGGKIVIQAKRYTNVVGVSAVRDLYGTLINEGANRGILVTTSQYGPDSYDFAKDKPITLLDGGNLLSLLDRHGHRARIDLAEAKKLGAARDQH